MSLLWLVLGLLGTVLPGTKVGEMLVLLFTLIVLPTGLLLSSLRLVIAWVRARKISQCPASCVPTDNASELRRAA